MRLTCPNCDAQYEVDDAVIPASGRDVQCSNCGTAWFVPGKAAPETRTAPAVTAPPPEPAPPRPEPEPEPEAQGEEAEEPAAAAETAAPEGGETPAEAGAQEGDGTPAAAPEAAQDAAPEESGDETTAEAPAEAADAGGGDTPSRSLDDAVLNVLREEAERETAARRAEGMPPVETQPDLGLSGTAAGLAATAAATAGRAGDAVEDAVYAGEGAAAGDGAETPDEAEGKGSRRGLLPDIEEINSTLSASSARADDDIPPTEEVVQQRRSGFRRGFSVALVLMIVALALYVLAPNIVARVPATEPALKPYVEAVDSLRLWLDEKMRSSTEAMKAGETDTAD